MKEGKGRINLNETMKNKALREYIRKKCNFESQEVLDEAIKNQDFRDKLIEFLIKGKKTPEFNSRFYQRIIEQEEKIATNTPGATKAVRYFEATSNYVPNFINRNLYKNNLLEQEAFFAQRQFNSLQPGLKASIAQELSLLADD